MRISLSLAFLMLLIPLYANAQTNATTQVDSKLVPWIGAWDIISDRTSDRPQDRNPRTPVATRPTPDGKGLEVIPEAQDTDRGKLLDERVTIEILPTEDGKGLEISRKSAQQPSVSEVLTLDGTKKPLDSENCTGWRSSRYLPEAGLITTSSQVTCKDSGSFATSSLKMILAADKMVDILAIKAGDQTRLAVRRMEYERDLPPYQESRISLAATAARTSLSAPWDLDKIIKLSGTVDSSILEAALLEKNNYLKLNTKSLKKMKKAEVPKQIIDLLVALSLPDKFQIRKNGDVELRPLTVVSSTDSIRYSNPFDYGYWPGSFFNCYSPFGYFYGLGFYNSWLPGSCFSYYSPFWWDYPMYFPNYPGVNTGGPSGRTVSRARVSARRGYVQIEPVPTGRTAIPRQGYRPRFGTPGSSTATSRGSSGSSGGYSSGSSGTAGYSGGSSSGGASASPGGYSSGGSGDGGQAVPR